ncbi:MAG: hypothetical protein J0L61_02780 [Planctomycetes bacterium]|nr:hypothetical protein [Planctomycetota bacterium]
MADPRTWGELFKFYYSDVKPLYSSVQISNALPVEVLFELNAAFDHVSRHWEYAESEADCVRKAYSHLKRSCLDIFKLMVKETTDQYRELRSVDTSILDNGDFDRGVIELYEKIRTGAIEARRLESSAAAKAEGIDSIFERWRVVFQDCVEFRKNYYLHGKIEWARRKQRRRRWLLVARDFLIGFVAGAASSALVWWFTK